MPVDLQPSSLASPITVQPRFSARLTAPCVAISEAMLSLRPLPTARKPRQSLPPCGAAGGAAEAMDGARAATAAIAATKTVERNDMGTPPSETVVGRKLLPGLADLKA